MMSTYIEVLKDDGTIKYACSECKAEFDTKRSCQVHRQFCKLCIGEDKYNKRRKKISNDMTGKKMPDYVRKKILNNPKCRDYLFSDRIPRTKNKSSYVNPATLPYSTYYTSYYGKYYFKSSYESVFAVWLLFKSIKFKYESIKLIHDNGKTYISDFYLPNTNEVIEIKGYDTPKIKVIEEVFLGHGYNINFIVGDKIWDYYNELKLSGVNIDEFWNKIKSYSVNHRYDKSSPLLRWVFDNDTNKILFLN